MRTRKASPVLMAAATVYERTNERTIRTHGRADETAPPGHGPRRHLGGSRRITAITAVIAAHGGHGRSERARRATTDRLTSSSELNAPRSSWAGGRCLAPSSRCAIFQTGGTDGALPQGERRRSLHARHDRVRGQCRGIAAIPCETGDARTGAHARNG